MSSPPAALCFCKVGNTPQHWKFEGLDEVSTRINILSWYTMQALRQLGQNVVRLQLLQLKLVKLGSVHRDISSLCRMPRPILAATSNTMPDIHMQQIRWKKKSAKEIKKNKKNQSKGGKDLSNEEINQVIDYDRYKQDLHQTVVQLKRQYMEELSIMTSQGGLLDNLSVSTDDGSFSLIQLGQIAQKNPHLIIVDLSTVPQYIPAVKKAIQDSGFGLNPQQDGTTLAVPVPRLTAEKRQQMVKNAKKIFENSKNHQRDIHRNYQKKLDKKKNDIPADDYNAMKNMMMQQMKDHHSDVEQMYKTKETELAAK